jgi:ribose-phosphate pyrophosphokinase
MSTILHFMPGSEAPATGLASALGIEDRPVSVRRFPDGESLVRVGRSGGTALLFCPLDHPDTKLVQVLLAASALRDSGAGQVILVAPYLGYMRQDMAFSPGEAVSQRVIGGLIAGSFDGLVTVDPHLHRTARLEDVVPGIAAPVVSAAATIAQAIAASVTPDTILVGPDAESRQWVEAVAAPLGLETMIGEKRRLGDRRVEIVLPEASRAAARPVMLVDDLISSGGTLRECARQLASAGAILRGAIATHCLADAADLAILARDGIARVVATDTVPGPASIIAMAPALAAAIRQQGWIEDGDGLVGD